MIRDRICQVIINQIWSIRNVDDDITLGSGVVGAKVGFVPASEPGSKIPGLSNHIGAAFGSTTADGVKVDVLFRHDGL